MSNRNRLHRWSYSLWGMFKNCPKSVKLAKIDKVPQPPVPAMERGSMIHLKAEHYLKGEIQGMPRELSKLKREYMALQKAGPEHIEEFWSLGKKWQRVKDGFRDGWFTLKADAALAPRKKLGSVAIGIDHKTGRYYPGHDEQAELTAIMLRKWYPDADGYEVEFFYIDQGFVQSYEFKEAYLRNRDDFWIERGELMMAERKFLPTPSEACDRCGFNSKKGGPCQDWKRRRN